MYMYINIYIYMFINVYINIHNYTTFTVKYSVYFLF